MKSFSIKIETKIDGVEAKFYPKEEMVCITYKDFTIINMPICDKKDSEVLVESWEECHADFFDSIQSKEFYNIANQ